MRCRTKLWSVGTSVAMLALAACGDRDPLSSRAGEPAAPAEKVTTSRPVAGTCEGCGPFPELIALPAGFGPEGIAAGNGTTFFAGSAGPPTAATLGQILVGDVRTGRLSELVAPTGIPALGMKHDPRSDLLFVCGGNSGRGTVYDATSGVEVTSYVFGEGTPSPFINDVVLTRTAAYFTNSAQPFLYRVGLGPEGEPAATFTAVSLPANFGVAGPYNPFARGNGVAATPDGAFLILVHTGEGNLYRVDASTFDVVQIALSGGDVGHGDGLLLEGQTLYVVQNQVNRVAVVELAPDYLSGTVTRHITEPFGSRRAVRVPTTIASFGDWLYAVTAYFAPPSPDWAVRLGK